MYGMPIKLSNWLMPGYVFSKYLAEIKTQVNPIRVITFGLG